MGQWQSPQGASEAALLAVMNQAIPAFGSIVKGSPNQLQLLDGIRAQKSWTLDGIGAQTDDVFVITGSVYVRRLGLYCTTATDTTTLTGVGFEIFDQVAPQTLDDGTLAASTSVAGTIIYKGAANGSPLIRIDPTVAFFGEAVIGADPFHGFTAVKQDGAVTEVRLNFVGDAALDCAIVAFADYIPISDDGALTAAP